MSSVEIWHNVLWSRYKGRVFSALHARAQAAGDDYRFFQLAETEGARVGLGGVDTSYHDYPYELMYRGSTDRLRWFRTVPRYIARALRSRADFVVIAGYSEPQNWAQLFVLLLTGRPRGVFCDSTLADQPARVLRGIAKRFFFTRCDLVFCYGERAKALALRYGARPESIVRRCQAAAMPDGYDAAEIPALRAARRSRSPRILYVGRLSREKNLERLIDAFGRYRATAPDAALRIVGSGPLQAALTAKAAAAGLGDAITFTGAMDQEALADEYLAATQFVLPSLSEPWGLVVNEALSYGCPVAVSDACGCVPELVDEAVTGVAFDPLDVDAIARAIAEVERRFVDPIAVAEACLGRISSYSPDAAAAQIHDGIDTFLKARKGR